jgi:16S rRNA (cytosine1402-N4)-methyltransferase
MSYPHIPVMLREVLAYLNCCPGKLIVDCTVGGAGHSSAILKKILPSGHLFGLDQDPEAIRNAHIRLKPFEGRYSLFHSNFIQLPEILSEQGVFTVDGILLDLGLSYYHLKKSGRGFSFEQDEKLDMRMNPENRLTASDIIHSFDQKDLTYIFKTYGEERFAQRIAKEIIKTRQRTSIKTARQLAQIILRAIPKNLDRKRIHPATRAFMALRIFVNNELERLESFLEKVPNSLNSKGRLCILSYHSLEDRIVKHRIREYESPCTCPPGFPKCVCHNEPTLRSLTKKPLRPAPEELQKNPMARSAKLRVAEKM